VERYNATVDVNCLREIRLNESLLGATPGDRQRLRWDLAGSAPVVEDDLAVKRTARRVVDHGVEGEPS
jgi:hypothetical protein